jgi:hypothetical protein
MDDGDVERYGAAAEKMAELGNVDPHEKPADPETNLRLANAVLQLLPGITPTATPSSESQHTASGRDARLAEACLVWTQKRNEEQPWYVIGERRNPGGRERRTGLLLGTPNFQDLGFSHYADASVSTSEWRRFKIVRSDRIIEALTDDSSPEAESIINNKRRTFIRPKRFWLSNPPKIEEEMKYQGAATLKGRIERRLNPQDGLPDMMLERHRAALHLGELIAVFGREIELSKLEEPATLHGPDCDQGRHQ